MIWLVASDIEDDALRSRAASILEGFGVRVQESVFECSLDERKRVVLQSRLSQLFRQSEGVNLRFYRLCASCRAASEGLGEGAAHHDWVVEDPG